MQIETSKLSNGLQVVTQTMPHLQSATLGLWVNAGSRCENDCQHGISHLLEHMAFKGTRRRSARDISEEIENVGGEINAATSTEFTTFYTRILKQDIPLSVDILSDILKNSVFDPIELEREKHVIIQEIGSVFDAPDEWVYDLLLETAFPEQALGRTILGTPQTIQHITPEQIKEFLTSHYHASGMVLSAAGGVAHAEIRSLADEAFSGFQGTWKPVLKKAHFNPGTLFKDKSLTETHIAIGFEGVSLYDDAYYTAQVLGSILGGGSSSRLFQEAREKRGLCYFISAFHWSFADTGLFGVSATCSGEEAGKLIDVIITELKSITQEIQASEIERAKAQLRTGLLMSLENPSACANHNARNLLVHGRIPTNEEFIAKIQAVDKTKLLALAGQILLNQDVAVVSIGDNRHIPDCKRFKSALSA